MIGGQKEEEEDTFGLRTSILSMILLRNQFGLELVPKNNDILMKGVIIRPILQWTCSLPSEATNFRRTSDDDAKPDDGTSFYHYRRLIITIPIYTINHANIRQ